MATISFSLGETQRRHCIMYAQYFTCCVRMASICIFTSAKALNHTLYKTNTKDFLFKQIIWDVIPAKMALKSSVWSVLGLFSPVKRIKLHGTTRCHHSGVVSCYFSTFCYGLKPASRLYIRQTALCRC